MEWHGFYACRRGFGTLMVLCGASAEETSQAMEIYVIHPISLRLIGRSGRNSSAFGRKTQNFHRTFHMLEE
jgi:hypothetical protein